MQRGQKGSEKAPHREKRFPNLISRMLGTLMPTMIASEWAGVS